MSDRTPAGAATARRRLMTRPSRLVIVPSSSAHWVEGSTTSASWAVSERKKSATTSVSSALSRFSTRTASGAETAMFEPTTKRPWTSLPNASINSYADFPRAGIDSTGTFQTSAM